LPLEYAELSLLEPDAIQDRRQAKRKFVPAESRRQGVTYVTSETGWDAVCALQSLLKGEMTAVGLFGHNGTGKSRLLYATAQDFVRAGRSVYILDGEKLHHCLTSDADDAKLRGRAMIQRATDADVLLWDELGYTGSHTKEWLPDSVLTEITHIIYRREASNLPTVFASNALAAGLQKRLGAPVWSRIEGMCGRNMFWLVGPDDFNYRAEGKARNNVLPFQR
jgi:DNA replication protein DnaC